MPKINSTWCCVASANGSQKRRDGSLAKDHPKSEDLTWLRKIHWQNSKLSEGWLLMYQTHITVKGWHECLAYTMDTKRMFGDVVRLSVRVSAPQSYQHHPISASSPAVHRQGARCKHSLGSGKCSLRSTQLHWFESGRAKESFHLKLWILINEFLSCILTVFVGNRFCLIGFSWVYSPEFSVLRDVSSTAWSSNARLCWWIVPRRIRAMKYNSWPQNWSYSRFGRGSTKMQQDPLRRSTYSTVGKRFKSLTQKCLKRGDMLVPTRLQLTIGTRALIHLPPIPCRLSSILEIHNRKMETKACAWFFQGHCQ